MLKIKDLQIPIYHQSTTVKQRIIIFLLNRLARAYGFLYKMKNW